MPRDEMRMRDEDKTAIALQDVKYEMPRNKNERSNPTTSQPCNPQNESKIAFLKKMQFRVNGHD
jgi:hypothetical protein